MCLRVGSDIDPLSLEGLGHLEILGKSGWDRVRAGVSGSGFESGVLDQAEAAHRSEDEPMAQLDLTGSRMHATAYRSFDCILHLTCLGAELRTNIDVVSAADDAFGITLGPENLGLYSAASVRGFSPLTAGNVRLDGLYFDQQGGTFDRLVTNTRIRVGLSAVEFPWPAPAGIVDYTLRMPRDAPSLTSIAYLGPYSTHDLDLNGSEYFLDKHLGVAAGVSYHSEEYVPGNTAHVASLGILSQ